MTALEIRSRRGRRDKSTPSPQPRVDNTHLRNPFTPQRGSRMMLLRRCTRRRFVFSKSSE